MADELDTALDKLAAQKAATSAPEVDTRPVVETLDMVNPSGDRWTMPAKHYDALLQKGWRLETPEEAKHIENQEKYGQGVLNPLITRC